MSEQRTGHRDKVLGHNRRIKVLNTIIDVLTSEETVDLVERYVQEKEPLHLIGVNADKINELNRNKRLRKIVNRCGIINADGISVVLASRFLGKPLPERVAGIDLMESLVKLSANKGYSIYLLGAKQEVVEKTESVLKRRYPELVVSGIRNGYFNQSEWPEVSAVLKGLRPDFVFVGITSPMKEYLVEYLQNDGNNCVFMGVGGSFDVISGTIPRAPLWVQKMNLEWLFRVIQEPRRLFKRYFIGNTEFILAVLAEKARTIMTR